MDNYLKEIDRLVSVCGGSEANLAWLFIRKEIAVRNNTSTNNAMTEISCLITGAIECIESRKDYRLALSKLNDAMQLTSS